MTIEQLDKVDGLGIDGQRNETVLLISDHLSWQDQSVHFAVLEGKLSAYLNFIRSGQLYESLPSAKGLPVRIKLMHQHSPNAAAELALDATGKKLAALGVAFSHESLPLDS